VQSRHELTTTVKVQPPPVMVTVVVPLCFVRIAVTALGLVEEPFAGIEMLVGLAFVTLRAKGLDAL
jgi:hypothetical protein